MTKAEESPAAGDGAVRLSVQGQAAHLLIDRPQARNAMTWRMYEQLEEACRAISQNRDIKVAVMRGAGGKAFIAGTDIEQFRAFSGGEDGVTYEEKVERFVAALENLPIPTIAVIDGWAVGGGMVLANACDLRIATPGARFGVPIAHTLGNCLSAANVGRLTATLGVAIVKRMLIAAEMIAAEELPRGYLSIVEASQIDAHVADLCGRLAGYAPLTIRATKEMLRRLGGDPVADGTDLVREIYGSADFREGVDAFLTKRTPQWRNE